MIFVVGLSESPPGCRHGLRHRVGARDRHRAGARCRRAGAGRYGDGGAPPGSGRGGPRGLGRSAASVEGERAACQRAADISARNGARLVECRLDGLDLVVTSRWSRRSSSSSGSRAGWPAPARSNQRLSGDGGAGGAGCAAGAAVATGSCRTRQNTMASLTTRRRAGRSGSGKMPQRPSPSSALTGGAARRRGRSWSFRWPRVRLRPCRAGDRRRDRRLHRAEGAGTPH